MFNYNKKIKRSYLRQSNGNILVEAALVIPLLVGITFFVVEFGNVFYLMNGLSQVARNAARFASVTPAYTQQDLINASGANSMLPDIKKFSLTIIPSAGSQRFVGAAITVTVQYNYTPYINPFGLFNIDKPWAPVLRSSSVVRSEVSNV